MKRLLPITALVLAACSSTPAPPLPPPPITWLLPPNSWQEDRIYRGPANADQNGCIEVDESTLVKGEIGRTTALPYGNDIARVWSPEGVEVLAVPDKLAATLVERNTGTFIGESGNAGAQDQSPPEPLVTVRPVAGEVINITSNITRWDGVQFKFQTRYYTKSVDPLVTCLLENPQTSTPTAYTQFFENGWLVEQRAGQVNPDGSLSVIVGRLEKKSP